MLPEGIIPESLPEAVELCAELLEQFARAGISVIQVGLHDSPELRQTSRRTVSSCFREL